MNGDFMKGNGLLLGAAFIGIILVGLVIHSELARQAEKLDRQMGALSNEIQKLIALPTLPEKEPMGYV
jgi:hypothetical protein